MYKFYSAILILCTLSWMKSTAQNSWAKRFEGIGTFSSPRVTDLNNDAIGDIVLGAGGKEFQPSDSAVIAIDGKNGKLIWKVSGVDQVFGTAAFIDIDNDGTDDVIINGRAAQLIAISGRTGKVIWRFITPKAEKNIWFNFYNPQLIPDQNNDGLDEILISNGGNVTAEPNKTEGRHVGHLVIINTKTGTIIKKAPMPDGKETYMSVSVLPNQPKDFKNIVYGTGGETLGGNLFITSVNEIMNGDLSKSIKLATSSNKGFIAPASWVDINKDGKHDIVVNAVDGRLLSFDGKTFKPIWEANMIGTEAYNAIAIGNFTNDSIPDFFTSNVQGAWPELGWSKQFMVNGKTGRIEAKDSLGFYQMSSPIAIDLNNDGKDEAILPMNYQIFDTIRRKYFYNDLSVFEFNKKKTTQLNLKSDGHNLAATPWAGDIDGNGFLDIIYVHGINIKQTYTFDGLQVNRIDTEIPITRKIKWGGYMGSNHNGVFNHN